MKAFPLLPTRHCFALISLLFTMVLSILTHSLGQASSTDYREILRLGRGTVSDAAWRADGDVIAVVGSQGVWIYDTNFQDILHLESRNTTIAAWNPQNTHIAAIGGMVDTKWDSAVYIWDVATSNLVQTLSISDYVSEITAVAWHPDGHQIATSGGNWVWIWDATTGELLKTLELSGWVTSLAWSPNSKFLLASTKLEVLLWEAEKDNFQTSLNVVDVKDVVWNSNSDQVALVRSSDQEQDNSLQIWDVSKHEPKLTIQAGSARTVAWSPDGTLVATGNSEHAIQVWNTATGTLVANLYGHTRPVSSIQWQPNGTILLSAAEDNTVRLWDVEPEHAPNAVRQPVILQKHIGAITALAWSPDDKNIVTGSNDGGIRLWSVNDTAVSLLGSHPGEVQAIAWSPDGDFIASGATSTSNAMQIWDVQTGEDIMLSPVENSASSVTAISWSPTGEDVAFSREDGTIVVWNLKQSIIEQTIHEVLAEGELVALWSPASNVIAGIQKVSPQKDVHLWDATTGDLQVILPCPGCLTLSSLAWQPNGDKLAVGGEYGESGGTVIIWDIETGDRVQTILANGSAITDISWNSVNQLAGIHGDSVDIWDAGSGELLQSIPAQSLLEVARWSHDGTILGVAGRDGIISLWGASNST